MNTLMRISLPAIAGSAMIAAVALVVPIGATASPISQPYALGNAIAVSPVETVQYRRGGPGGYYRGGPRARYGHRNYNRGWGGPGPIIGGLAAGALIGSAIAAPQVYAAPPVVYRGNSAVEHCVQRFRSYDVRSGTYLGYDGNRHACP